MSPTLPRLALLAVVAVGLPAAPAWAAAGTTTVAYEGHPAHVSDAWPEGTGAVVNDPARTSGWNPWFTEWPNDVNHYAFAIRSTADVNRLIEKLAAINTPLRQVRLSYLKEPAVLGWMTKLPAGNATPVIFSLGNQQRIDQWYAQVRKPFGKIEFRAAPVAVPPTLTIFVGHAAVDLDQLQIPAGVTVESGYVPTLFHRSNSTLDPPAGSENSKSPPPGPGPVELDPESQAAAERIETFLDKRPDGGGNR